MSGKTASPGGGRRSKVRAGEACAVSTGATAQLQGGRCCPDAVFVNGGFPGMVLVPMGPVSDRVRMQDAGNYRYHAVASIRNVRIWSGWPSLRFSCLSSGYQNLPSAATGQPE